MPHTTGNYRPEHSLDDIHPTHVYDRDTFKTVRKRLENHLEARRLAAAALEAAS